MLRPRYAVMAFFSGAKGGTGKSTLAANLAILLSQNLRTNVLLIDLGIDSSQTASRTLGVVPERAGALDYLVGSIDDAKQLPARSSYLPSVFVVPPGTVKSFQLSISTKEIYPRWLNMINTLVMTTASPVVLVDMPANAPTAITVPALITSQIINVVLDYANYSDYVLREIDDNYIQPMLSLKYAKIVNVVLNKALPGMDAVDVRVRGYAHGGEVITLPTSVIVQYLTAGLKPVVLYQPKGSLAQFRKALDGLTETLTRQIKAVLTGHIG